MPKRAEKSTALFDKSGLDDILNTFSSKNARWCNGSTTDSGSVCLGSSPGRAANENIRQEDCPMV